MAESESKFMNHPLLLGLMAACALLPACIVEADDPGPRPTAVGSNSGSLVLDWTIDGSKNPDQCDQSDASTLDITVTTLSGAPVGEFQDSCRAFATAVDLPAGNYSAEAVLLDGSGRDRTTAVQLGTFTLYGDDQLSVPVDFPPSSFY
jgi:hypothetical protein